jgi:predicted metal-dependent hydrolase
VRAYPELELEDSRWYKTQVPRCKISSSQRAPTRSLRIGTRLVPLLLVPHRRARRYVLRLRRDGTARVTIPKGGSTADAVRFVEKNAKWLEKQFVRQATLPTQPLPWKPGTAILFRGDLVVLSLDAGAPGTLLIAEERVPVGEVAGDFRPSVEQFLWCLATRELPGRVTELAGQHQAPVRRVQVKNQKSRWGSCSRRGTVSLNWRLIQVPPSVRDYIILHELAHLKHMNHSRDFWAEVARLCPDFLQAEGWLKTNSRRLLQR